MLTGMPAFGSAAEREQAESYFTDLLSYRCAALLLLYMILSPFLLV